MELAQYIKVVRKWLWLILLSAFVAGGVSFILNTGRPSVYTASTTIMIGRITEQRNPTSGEIAIAQDLAQTYAQLLKTFGVLQGTIDELGLTISPENLERRITSRIIQNTSLLVINVDYTDPVLAADLANQLAAQLIAQSPTGLSAETEAQVDLANDQINALSAQLQDSRLQLANVDAQLATAESDSERERLTEQRNSLIDQINQASTAIAQFTDTVTRLQSFINNPVVIEAARVPTSPSDASIIVVTFVPALLGGLAALGFALALEYLDDTVRTSEQAAQITKLPVLGAVARYGKRSEPDRKRLVTNFPSMSPVAESYRTLRTNLLFAGGGNKGVYVITSASPEEGKSMTASNLAVTMALAGLQVVLIDADLRRPKLHNVFDLENSVGLTTLLFADPGQSNGNGRMAGEDGDESKLPVNLRQCLQSTAVPRLRVITSGFIPSNPTEILGSALMRRWVETFRASPNIDVVLFDTPPCLMVADSGVLAATAKADVVLVIDAGRTRRAAALKAKEQFTNLSVEVKGVVLNRMNPREESYDYGYGYYYYYGPREGERQRGLRRNFKSNGSKSE